MRNEMVIDDGDIALFKEQGFLVIKNLISEAMLNRVQIPLEAWVEKLIRGMECSGSS